MVAGGLIALRAVAGENPAVVWWSAPVEPGELVQVHGGAWGTNPVVEAVALSDRSPGSPQTAGAADFRKATRVVPAKVTDTGVCFERPRKLDGGLVACRIVSESGEASDAFVLNEPETWWLAGDHGEEASPGGSLRFFGRCLSRNEKARAVLADGTRNVELKLTKKDVWSLDANVPDDLKAGTYQAFVHNGGGGCDGWRSAGTIKICAHDEVWKTNRFDVTAFGAIANDGMDDTLAMQAALAAAGTNGGGIVWLPRGRFQCNGTLRIPAHTLLRGESRETTELYWPDCEDPPENLIEGGTAFGIEELFIHSGKYRNGIVCTNATAGRHALGGGERVDEFTASDITIRRVRLKLIIDQFILRNTAEYEKRAYLRGNGLVIRDAKNVRVEDCDIYASKEGSTTLYFILSAEHLRIANCRINGSGWAVVGGDKVIFENNEAWNCTYSVAPVCRNLFWSNNRQHDLFTNNREAITHDGARTAFRGLIAARCDGTRMETDSFDWKDAARLGPSYWVDREIQLVEGRGAGQTRTITAITNNTVTIDRPWSIAPDATSRFVIASERKHLLYVDNFTEDTSIAIQLYGGLTDGILARNRCVRSGGFRGFGMDYHGIIPLWFVQFLDNEIIEGNSYRGPSNEVPPRDSSMEIVDHGNTNMLTRSNIIRGGRLENNSRIVIGGVNAIVENCTVKNSDVGISVPPKNSDAIVLHNNHFQNVIAPLDPVAMARAVMHPADRAMAMIAGAETILGPAAPAAWRDVKAKLSRLAGDPGINDLPADTKARELLADAVRSLSDAMKTNAVDARVVASLLGASVRIRDWEPAMWRLIISGEASSVSFSLLATLSAVAPAATCRFVGDEMPGWKFSCEPVRLVPGQATEMKTSAAAPAGAKGFFRLPATIEYSGDGWTLRCRDRLKTLTENRLVQWIAAGPFASPTNAPFDSRKAVRENPINLKAAYETLAGRRGWQVATNANVHGAVNIGEIAGANSNEAAVVALSVFRVARPVTLRFDAHDNERLFMDGARLGSDTSRGNWGSVSLAPGLHVLKAVTSSPEKGAAWSMRIACEISEACLPGDFVVVPAAEVLGMESLPQGPGEK